ncbi:MAG: cobalamin-dependent protein [Clostridia bacterium]|jgi:trimethylamine corrinoid protein|nr:cobalamin-dependent protein [Clostridia bacterium]
MIDNSILEAAANSIIKSDQTKAEEIANEVLEKGLEPLEVITKGYTVGIIKVGDLFERGKLFLPELIQCAEVMKNVTAILNNAISTDEEASSSKQVKGKVLIATVEGDVHDIGKGIVCSILAANGLEVTDMGRDVPAEKIVKKAEEIKADVIGTSALLTTTMIRQKDLEEILVEKGIRNKYITVVGGAPVTVGWAKKIGADIYAENAVDGVNKILVALQKR